MKAALESRLIYKEGVKTRKLRTKLNDEDRREERRILAASVSIRGKVPAVFTAILLLAPSAFGAESLPIEVIQLPALRVEGKPAAAHTQGLEVIGGKYYVSARLDSSRPRRALLLSAETAGTNWSAWDVSPAGSGAILDHPGGMQSDGKRLWVPVAVTKPKSQSLIRVFALDKMLPGQPLKTEFEFSVQDHIGALAVTPARGLLFGANWDTETVYVWDLQGHLKQTLSGDGLAKRGLGLGAAGNTAGGVAAQDWKVVGDRLFASGLTRPIALQPRSRWLVFTNFLEAGFQRREVSLPLQHGTELGREAMAVSGEAVYFLPEDLRETNRLFRARLADLISD